MRASGKLLRGVECSQDPSQRDGPFIQRIICTENSSSPVKCSIAKARTECALNTDHERGVTPVLVTVLIVVSNRRYKSITTRPNASVRGERGWMGQGLGGTQRFCVSSCNDRKYSS